MTPRRNQLNNALLTVLLMAAVAACADYLSLRSFHRFDLTADSEFTLSPAARTIVRSLEAPVQVEVFLSENLPPQFAVHTRAIRDKLSEFQAISAVPFEITYTDPGDDTEAQQRAARLGVQPQQAEIRSRGKLELQQIWIGISVLYRDAQQVLPFVSDTSTLEYDLARELRSAQQGGRKKKIVVATGHGEPDLAAALDDPRNPLRSVAAALTQTYELEAVDLSTATEIPADADIVLEMGAQQPLSDAALFALDQHVMRGGALGLFPLSAVPDPRTRQIQPAPVDFDPLVQPWGITIGDDLVVDRELNGVIRLPVTVRTPLGPAMTQRQVNSPLVPIVRDIADHPVTEALESLIVPFAVPIDTASAEGRSDITVTALARSSAHSTVGAPVTSLDPHTLDAVAPSEVAGPYTVLAALEGVLPSGWRDRSAPGLGIDEQGSDRTIPESPTGTRVVLGTSFEMPLANPGLLYGIVDWMAADETLSAIRPKVTTPAVMEPVTPATQSALRAANVFGVPLLFALLGWVRARSRRS